MKQLTFLLFALPLSLAAQSTVGLLQYDPGNEAGYVLFSPNASDTTYLVDKCGYRVHSWTSNQSPGQSVRLLENGLLLRPGRSNNPVFTAGGQGGIIELLDWNGQVLWSYSVSSATECQHHDVYPMPNGNILVLSWDLKTPSQAIAAGRDTARIGVSLWSEKIMELQPVGTSGANIVWQWNAWDHLVQAYDPTKTNFGAVAQHPELIHLNQFSGPATATDWLHCNSLDYDSTTDQIILSCHNFSEIWFIDHGTTTAEAAGHTGGRYGKGGDLLYRWGNPQTYGRGTVADKRLFGQHHPHRIKSGMNDAGKVLIFNNGLGRPAGNYSTVEVLELPMDSIGNFAAPGTGPYLPDSAVWKYTAPVPTDFFSQNISGAQRLENGNTLICSGQNGIFFEIDQSKNTVWKYVSPTTTGGNPIAQGTVPTQNSVFRCTLYPATYPGLSGHNLTPGAPIELNPTASACTMLGTGGSPASTDIRREKLSIIRIGENTWRADWIGNPERILIRVLDLCGRETVALRPLELNGTEPVYFSLEPPATGWQLLEATNGVQRWSFRVVR
ncbi:MAG: hypothetical protein RL021_2164 [Bacteroidota bacterium]